MGLDELEKYAFDLGGLPEFEVIDLSCLKALDTYGALLLSDLLRKNGYGLDRVIDPEKRYIKLLDLIFARERACKEQKPKSLLLVFSEFLVKKIKDYLSFFDFLGRLLSHCFSHIRDFEWRVFF